MVNNKEEYLIKEIILENLPINERIRIKRKLICEEMDLKDINDDEIWKIIKKDSKYMTKLKTNIVGLFKIIQFLRLNYDKYTITEYCDNIQELIILDINENIELDELLLNDINENLSRIIFKNINKIKFINSNIILNNYEINYWLDWLFNNITLNGKYGLELYFKDCRFYYNNISKSQTLRIDNKRRKILNNNNQNMEENKSFMFSLLSKIMNNMNLIKEKLLSFNLVNIVIDQIELRNIFDLILNKMEIKLSELNISQLLLFDDTKKKIRNQVYLNNIIKYMNLEKMGTNLMNLRILSFHSNHLNDENALLIMKEFS
ncbi:hypothetical protein [Cryptosporidium parvum Iowa II]|uniref:Uncharacterized protein n=1 Tax=Cryptosporidium parvum (strain Iowa II) TaxID=353152 RepID=Q5CPI4_CRYPI|nr:hypothetical protein [Cryptosporidium parvum Iowa II]EAK87350.1 hypothetical protein cgd6_290 [Cryptosporidium parvum Iowa II]